eukprot:553403-Rhodomonas_salina.2
MIRSGIACTLARLVLVVPDGVCFDMRMGTRWSEIALQSASEIAVDESTTLPSCKSRITAAHHGVPAVKALQ